MRIMAEVSLQAAHHPRSFLIAGNIET